MAQFADFRLQKELQNIQLSSQSNLLSLNPPSPKYHRSFLYSLVVTEGIYKNRTFTFTINIREEYPSKPPKLVCNTNIFHPNVDEIGRVCTEVLREGWSSAYGIETVLMAVHMIFFDVCGDDALNVQAGDLLKTDYEEFVRRAQED